jgi:adenine phosphoribosyltransferase
MTDLKSLVVDVPDFPKPGILFRDIAPLLRTHFVDTINAVEALFTEEEWKGIEAVAGIESRGFILAAGLAARRGLGFVPIRKKGKLPPPVIDVAHDLEYGSSVLEMQPGSGRIFVIDDVLATGGTLRAAGDLCVRAGYDVQGMGVLIDIALVSDFTWRDLPARSAIRYAS